jgi:hypothetical protein
MQMLLKIKTHIQDQVNRVKLKFLVADASQQEQASKCVENWANSK